MREIIHNLMTIFLCGLLVGCHCLPCSM